MNDKHSWREQDRETRAVCATWLVYKSQVESYQRLKNGTWSRFARLSVLLSADQG